MNAYELADCLEALCRESKGSFTKDAYIMLRQQADRIAELEKVSKPVAWMDYLEHSDVYDLNVSGRGIPLYTTPQIKELSDEEIIQVFDECYPNNGDGDVVTLIDFARAILKKASDK